MSKVSIIIPNFNRATYLKQAVSSVLKQTYVDWEVLIVDDGSSDDSKQTILDFKDNRIHWIERNGDLKGASVCRNIGVNEAQGSYIIFLDSDDMLAKHCLEQRVSILKLNPNLDFAVFKMQFFKEQPGDDLRIWNIDTREDVLQRFLNLDTVWQTTGPIWRKETLKTIGCFNPVLQCWQDIDIHIKALSFSLKYKIYYDMPADCWYRKDSENSISQSSTNSLVKLQSKRILLEWVKSNNILNSYSHLNMVIHILVSAINGYQYKFFFNLYNENKTKMPVKLRHSILKMALIKFSRSTKLKSIQSIYNRVKESLVSNNSTIGKYNA
ncbi:glycosyltransferase family 2 protein [Psychroserpens luteus]|uniref:Glycosyltransferase family 2 protein n=1 Tax=Psychroserpens luteus TaxID=1434066 RepID=A0ABW5ZZ22_9FLAO|nr:glycosyltransferase family A protein [Psychroserpens luteus]